MLPPGVEFAADAPRDGARVLVDNRTELPDQLVEGAVETLFVENASLAGIQASTFQTYAAEGGLLARSKYRTPANVYDEIRLARDLADRDDDVRSTIGMMIAIAYSGGMQNAHRDERTLELFDGLAAFMNLDGALKRIYREYLIAGQAVTATLFSRRQQVPVGDEGDSEQLVAPLIGTLAAEKIRPIGSDLFGNAELAYVPDGDERLGDWLQAFFEPSISAARKAELRVQDPVAATMFTGPVELDNEADFATVTTRAYRLNPRMVQRVKMTGDDTPRPLLTADFALLEAKRLLNLMDYALLQGGMNFIVVAKKGSDQLPAQPEEVKNLETVVRRATRTGVIIGDHRLSFEIITPRLDELLQREKRVLLGRKISRLLLRLPEMPEQAEGVQADVEILSRVIESDRQDVRRHVERTIYQEAAQRNRLLTKGAPRIWHPRIVLQGTQYFTDYVLKLRDRGDIPRKAAVEAAGFDWEAGVEQRKRELEDNVDEVMAPAAVPFSSPNAGPQDNNEGRPTGTSPDNGRPGASPGAGRDNVRPLRTINRNAGETIRAVQEDGELRRVGERTFEILAEYPDREIGRVTPLERDALGAQRPFRAGPLAVIPVNPGHQADDVRAVRLTRGLSMLLGTRRRDGALIAKALCFREPEFDVLGAEEAALRWGFPVAGWEQAEEPEELARAQAQPPTVIVNAGQATRKVVHRDENGAITEITEEPIVADA